MPMALFSTARSVVTLGTLALSLKEKGRPTSASPFSSLSLSSV